MSKDIWHTADITPDPCRILICKTNKGQNYTAIIPSPQEWNTMILPEFYNLGDIDNAERIEQYAYLDDLLALETELERTRKALDILLLTINRLENQNYKDYAWHLRLAIAKIKAIGIADTALDQITALEQKDK